MRLTVTSGKPLMPILILSRVACSSSYEMGTLSHVITRQPAGSLKVPDGSGCGSQAFFGYSALPGCHPLPLTALLSSEDVPRNIFNPLSIYGCHFSSVVRFENSFAKISSVGQSSEMAWLLSCINPIR